MMAEHQARDASGRYVSLETLVERERREHGRTHDRERAIARETAQRLEREVEETARRLERMVEETAVRLEKGVSKALDAVAATAGIHAAAHREQHVAHERIHAVEEENRKKAESTIDSRLDGMNEFRGALQDQASRSVTRDYYDARHEDLKEKVIAIEKRMAYYAGGAAVTGAIIAVVVKIAIGG